MTVVDRIKRRIEYEIEAEKEKIGRSEFMEAFNGLVSFLKKLERMIEDQLVEIKEDLQTFRKALKKDVDATLDAQVRKVDAILATVKDGHTPIKGVDYTDGQDGKDADEDAITARIIDELSPLINEEVTGEVIANKLEALPEPQKLEMSAIRGLLEELKKLRQIKSTTVVQNGAVTGRDIIKVYDLSSQLDGSTKVFALPSFWRILSVNFSSAPWIARPTVDYTTAASQITFTSQIDAGTTLASGQSVTIIYVVG